jgi:soluble lytic murein transglycosylase
MSGFFVLLLFTAALAGWPQMASAQTGEFRESFAKAYQLYSSGNSAQAKELFQETSDATYGLADYSLYYLARIAADEPDREQARRYLEQLRDRFPQSVWSHAASLLRAKLDIADGKLASANETLRVLRTDKLLNRELATEAQFLQGQIYEARGTPKDIERAYALYRELRNAAPDSRWAAAARKDQTRLRLKFPEKFPFNTAAAQAEEADQLARERQINEAEDLYKKLLRGSAQSSERLRFLTKLASLYLSSGNRNQALPVLEQIIRDHSESSEAPKAVYQIGQIYWNRHENDRALEYFKKLLEKYPNSEFVDRAQYASADIHEYFGRKEDAISYYTSVQKQFPKSQVRDDAAWRLAWLYYRGGEYGLAEAHFRSLAERSTNGPFASSALYWQGRTAERLGENEAAARNYRQLANAGEESYYQTLALRRLEQLGTPIEMLKRTAPSAISESDPLLGAASSFHLIRARELAALSLHQLAIVEIDEINRRTKSPERLRPFLMREYFKNQAYSRSLALAQQLPSGDSARDFYRYPLAYWDTIQQKTSDRGVDPYLVVALIRQESLFNTRARSPASAYGLMQLILPTAVRVAKQIGLPAPNPERLFEPEFNLTLGTQYLKDLLDRYSNNWFKAIAAYNAGEAAVDRWEREIVTDDIEEFVERIPYVETRGYVKLVMRNHRIYKRLYEAQR